MRRLPTALLTSLLLAVSLGHQPGIELRGTPRCPGILRVEGRKGRGGRRMAPVWRLQPRDPAALLVDQHGGIMPPGRESEFYNKIRELSWVLDVAREHDRAQRRGAPEQATLRRGEFGPREADDRGLRGRVVLGH